MVTLPALATGADSTQGVPWYGAPGRTESVADIMARDKLNASLGLATPPVESPRLLPHPMGLPENPASPFISQFPASAASGGPRFAFGQYGPQTEGVNWLGAQFSDTIGYVPPDSMGAVGPTQFLVAVNGRIRVFDKLGNVGALNTTTDNFFSSVLGGSSTSDPRVRFDRLSGRWYVTMITVNTPNHVLIAVSSGSTITGSSSFTFFQFEQDLVGPQPNSDTGGFADYDSLGIDANALYIGVNIFNASGTAFIGSTAFVVNKAQLLSGTLMVTPFRQMATNTAPGPVSPQGVDNDDPSAAEGYVIGTDSQVFGLLQVRRISTPGGTPSISGNLSVSVPATDLPLNPQPLGSSFPLDALDDRLFSARMHLGVLWTAHNIEVDDTGAASSSGGRTGSRWYELSNLTTTPALAQSGTLFDSSNTNTRSYWIPSCTMSGQGHMALACSVGGAAEHAEIAEAGRLSGDALGTLQAPTVVTSSSTAYNLQSANPQRWGDYSIVTVDPNDDMTMWTVQEYCNATNSWAVRVVQLIAPPPATPASANPSSVAAGSSNVNVTITGTSTGGSGFFDPGSGFPNHIAASVGGTGVTVNSVMFTDPTHATVNISVASNASTGADTVTITNPDSQAATSATGILTITGNGSAPTISTISPTSTPACGAGFTLTVNGTNYVSGATVDWNGTALATTFVSAAQLTATVPAANIAAPGSAAITVVNPDSSTSNTVTFTITNPVPVLSSISPASVNACGPAFTLTVNGSCFISASTVNWNGASLSTTFVSASQLTATVPGSDTASPGSASVTVVTPSPGGGTSAPATFTIDNPTPVLSSINPTSAQAGGPSFTLTANGSCFISSSTIDWNGSPLTTSFVSASQLTATVSSSLIVSAGTASVTVVTPGPGGGTSAAQTFTIGNAPTITSLSPSSTPACGPSFTLTVNGSSFVSGGVVNWNGSPLSTTFVSSGQLTATVPSGDIANSGTASVTVTQNSVTSNAVTFTITNPVPVITSLSPASVKHGHATFTLTVNGRCLISSSVVHWNGSALATTFVSATQLRATVPGSLVHTVGSANVTVVTPAPGGGTSNTLVFVIRR